MDYGFPPGGLERLFRSYDRIVAHGVHRGKPDEPPWHTEEPGKETAKDPDSKATEPSPEPQRVVGDVPEPYEAAEARDAQLKANLGYDPKKSWGDIRAEDIVKGESLMERRSKYPNGASFEQDEKGLENAYNDKTSKGVFYDPETRTEYIKGSSTPRDGFDDLTKIPIWGDTKQAERYQEADKAYLGLQASGKPVERVVGHSLGGSVALELAKDRGIQHSRTFGAPVLDMNPFGNAERYRHPLDPVSILDRGAKWGNVKAYPHSYTGFLTE